MATLDLTVVDGARSASYWAAKKKPEAWKLAAAAAAGKWELDTGFPEMTEAEFDAAIQAAGEIRIG